MNNLTCNGAQKLLFLLTSFVLLGACKKEETLAAATIVELKVNGKPFMASIGKTSLARIYLEEHRDTTLAYTGFLMQFQKDDSIISISIDQNSNATKLTTGTYDYEYQPGVVKAYSSTAVLGAKSVNTMKILHCKTMLQSINEKQGIISFSFNSDLYLYSGDTVNVSGAITNARFESFNIVRGR